MLIRRSTRVRCTALAAVLTLASFTLAACGSDGDGARSVGNPSAGDPAAIALGERLYAEHCSSCHGEDGSGNGPEATAHDPPPSNLDVHVPHHADIALFAVLTRGIPGTTMHSWADELSEEQRWAIVNYLVAEHGGTAPQAGDLLRPPASSAQPGTDVTRIQEMSPRQFYAVNCEGCHGARREGRVGPPLTSATLILDDDVYIDAILNGRPSTLMPAWAGLTGLTRAEAELLVKWMRAEEAER